MHDNVIVQSMLHLRQNRFNKRLTPYLLVAPVVLLLLFFLAIPLGTGLYTSLTNMRIGREAQAQFVGLKNYMLLFTSGEFYESARITFSFFLSCATAEMLLGTGLALLLNRQIKGIRIYRAICLIPFMMPTVVCGLIWRQLMDPEGAINYIFGLHYFPWLASTRTVIMGLVVIDVWQTTPEVIILLLAGLQTIPQDIYEVAQLDGANAWQTLRLVTFPLVLPYFLISLMIRSIELIQVLDIILVATNGGPGTSSQVLHISAYRESFQNSFIGLGSAWAFVLGLIVLIVVLLISRRFVAAQAAAYGEGKLK